MDNQKNVKEFSCNDTITFKMSLTPEQHNMMREWSLSIPTLYMLDICVVNITKLSNASLEANQRKANLVNYLRELDRPTNCFSYFFALMEKVSDSRGVDTNEQLEEKILSDLSYMRSFFKHARIGETDEFALAFLKEIRGMPIEKNRSNYLKLIEALNNQFRLSNPVAPSQRLKKAKTIIKKADFLNVSRQHPVVAIGLACLYGNLAAKKLMKFKENPEKFNAENALADIMLITRFAGVQLEIEHTGRSGGNYLRSEFITDDNGLIDIIKCFKPRAVKHQDYHDEHKTELTMTLELSNLLTDIQDDEYNEILDILIESKC